MLKTLGVTPDMIGPSLLAPKTQAILAPLIEKVAFVERLGGDGPGDPGGDDAVPYARTPIWRLIVTIRKGRVFVRQQRH